MTTYILISIIQAMGISLGVGSSTLAILNFFYAIKDGKIEPAERGIMGVNYIVLRVAMVIILLTTAYLFVTDMVNATTITAYTYAQLTIIFVLFLNAILMTARIMPSSFGPAIQASSWYALGFLLTLVPHDLTDFTYVTFIISYFGFFVFVTLLIKFVMSVLKKRSEPSQSA
ncbi:MAG: hypothetical protein R3B53_03830 [Candidatus Paceibacterota bacterium]